MTGSKPTPEELLRLCNHWLEDEALLVSTDLWNRGQITLATAILEGRTLARALKEHLSAPPAVGRDDVIEECALSLETLAEQTASPVAARTYNSGIATIRALKSPTSPTIVKTSSADIAGLNNE